MVVPKCWLSFFLYSPFCSATLDPTMSLPLTMWTNAVHYSFYMPSCVALNDGDDKGGNDRDVNALSAALTDPGCTAGLWSLSLRRLCNLALKLALLMGLCFSFFLSYPLILPIPAFLSESCETLLFFQACSLRDHTIYIKVDMPTTTFATNILYICKGMKCNYLAS